MNSKPHSIVEYYGGGKIGSKCGYCKSTNKNLSSGMWAHSLTVSDYQELIDRGWRRSGSYCYKPTMDSTCCPMYTIRCRVTEFKMSKSQKKVLKRFNKQLAGEGAIEYHPGDSRKMSTCSSNGDTDSDICTEGGDLFVKSTNTPQDINIKDVNSAFNGEHKEEPKTSNTSQNNVVSEAVEETVSEHNVKISKPNELNQKVVKKGGGPDPEKAPCKKAKQLRKERKLEKLKEKGIDVTSLENTSKCKEKQVEDLINELPDSIKDKLEIKLVRTSPPSPEWLASSKESHEVFKKYQSVIHEDKDTSYSHFSDFLVQSPLVEEYSETGPRCGYGSFHQQYRLGGKLIAVGVIDILPACVSAVYFFYDPLYTSMTLGTYGALREIAFTRHLHSVAPELKYYYMGYYIHSCRKMRYKGQFHPSDLLCPETYNWTPIKEAIPKLEAFPYSRLDPDIDKLDESSPTSEDIDSIPVLVSQMTVRYNVYKKTFVVSSREKEEIVKYANFVGAKCTRRMILVR